jgi:pSer/pThr/pTyr-binding forkhead associated (FHA) protein
VVRYITENEEETIYEPPPGAYLVLMVDGRASQTFPVRGAVHLGRDRTNSVVVSDQKVSRHHAILLPKEDAYVLSDQGSANGTFLNGVLISQPTRLKPQDKISIGDTVFVFTTNPDNLPVMSEPKPVIESALPATASVPERLPATNINDKSSATTLELGENKPLWMTLGCLGMIIIALLLAVAVMLGLLIGRAQAAALLPTAVDYLAAINPIVVIAA